MTPSDVRADDRSTIHFLLELARALHRYGTPAHRLEEAMTLISGRLGLPAEIFSTPTTIIMSFGEPWELRTRMQRVETGALDLGKLALVDHLADEVAARRMTPEDGLARLAALPAASPTYGQGLSTLANAITGAAMCVFFGGTLVDVAVAGGFGAALGALSWLTRRRAEQARVLELIGAFLAAFGAGALAHLLPTMRPAIVTIAALIVLLPGLSLTVAMTELATRNLISGTARLMSAVIILLELVVGVAVGDRLAAQLGAPTHEVAAALPAWTEWVALVAAALAATVVVQAERRALGWIIGACVVGYVGSKYGVRWAGSQIGVILGALGLGVMANLYARILDRPAQVVQVPALLLLVPGSVGFRGMTSLASHDTLSGIDALFAMFVVATSIVAGFLLSNAVVSPRRIL